MPSMNNARRPPGRGPHRVRRQAAAMAVVLACLLVIMLISGTVVRGMLLQQRQAKSELRQLQALWLAEAAAVLAFEQLRADGEYAGQTWRTAVDENSGLVGIAEIEVHPVDRQPAQRSLHIRATYPDDPVERVVLDREITVTLPALGDSA